MDIFSHGLWAGAAYKAANKKIKNQLNVYSAVFWGMFPDLFSFSIPFVWLAYNLISGNMNFSDFPRPEHSEPMPPDTLPIFRLTSVLYSVSHSVAVFFAIFALIYLIKRKFVWEMGGWLIHILIDIPTHSYKFYPTPFLWPFSEWKFDGFSWGQPWFIILNYSAIILIYWLIRKRK
ncbi:MAG: metal-dependent hydrolase [Candidatus Paceibacterota bacterium]